MMRALSFSELQQRFGGTCYGDVLSFTQLETDSRSDLTGKVFLALKGERFDGHSFCAQAAEQGAAGLVVSEYQPDIDLPQWCVDDTRIALGQIAVFNRDLFQGPVVGITGNSGKTTVKEMLGSILALASDAGSVLITAGNFNNDIGVPLTLLRLSPEHKFAVIELGANHLGEIDYCARLAKPDVGVVLNVTGAHLGEFGSMENIAQAKGELISALTPDGRVVINRDDNFAGYWQQLAGERELTGYGLESEAGDPELVADNLVARNIQSSAESGHQAGYCFDLCYQNDAQPVQLNVPAKHNVSNALAASAAALQLGLTLTVIAEGLQAFSGVGGRLQTVTGFKQSRIINDSYNANPGSVRAAIDTLMDYTGQHILVLGDIGELGDESASAHSALGEYAREKQVDYLFTTGTFSEHTASTFGKGARHFSDKEVLAEVVATLLTPETTVLVKGSRSSRMEEVVNALCPSD